MPTIRSIDEVMLEEEKSSGKSSVVSTERVSSPDEEEKDLRTKVASNSNTSAKCDDAND